MLKEWKKQEVGLKNKGTTLKDWQTNKKSVQKTGRRVTHHLSRFEWYFIEVSEREAVFWIPVTILQLLRVTRGLVPVRVSILGTKESQCDIKEAAGTLILHVLTCERMDFSWKPSSGPL